MNKKNLSEISQLIDAGMNPNQTNAWGDFPLLSSSNPEMVQMLIQKGADVNCRDKYGRTALMKATERGDVKIVQLLIESGADVNMKNSGGRTALILAREAGMEETEKALVQADAMDDRVTALNGQPLPEEGGEPLQACKKLSPGDSTGKCLCFKGIGFWLERGLF